MKQSAVFYTREDENDQPIHRSSFIIHRYLRMKLIAFILPFLPVALPAQPVLQRDLNLPRAGDKIIKQQVEYKDPGRSGPDVLWDFSGLNTVNPEYRLDYRLPRANRHNRYVLGRDTFEVNRVGENELLKGHEHFTQYYYRIKGDTLYSLGYENPTALMHHNEPLPAIAYPFGYGQSIRQDYSSEGLYSSLVPISIYGDIIIEADAYGKMLLPSKDTLNQVLRVKTVQTILENDSLKENDDTPVKMRVETYRWYARGYRYPVFEAVRSVNLQDSVTAEFNTAFFYPPQEHYYLADDEENAALQEEGNDIDDPWAGLTYNIFPNPVSYSLNLELFLPKATNIRVQIRTTMGAIVLDEDKGHFPAGLHNFQFNTSALQVGNYILDVGLNGKLISGIIMKR
jgi:hypothetical protein